MCIRDSCTTWPVTPPPPHPLSRTSPRPATASAPAGAKVQTAPMPGKIVDIKLNVGDAVSNGTVVMVLEAMKMENQIIAESDGKIASIAVAKGDMVNPGDELFSIA